MTFPHRVRLCLLLAACLPALAADKRVKADAPWVALHVLDQQNDADLQAIEAQLPAQVVTRIEAFVEMLGAGRAA